jgi:Icc-related predicted phosphoesterase
VKILAVSDMVDDRLYNEKVAEFHPGVGLVLGCGDLPFEYLEFLSCALNAPLLYVPGNHDPAFKKGKDGDPGVCCDPLDQDIVFTKGLNIAGIGGSIRYKPGRPNQYTQAEMRSRLTAFAPKIMWHLARHGKRLDIVIAHSPPLGIHDDEDQPHVGFAAFRDFIRLFKPRYFLHGHTIVYKSNLKPPVTEFHETTVINVYPYRVLEIPD